MYHQKNSEVMKCRLLKFLDLLRKISTIPSNEFTVFIFKGNYRSNSIICSQILNNNFEIRNSFRSSSLSVNLVVL